MKVHYLLVLSHLCFFHYFLIINSIVNNILGHVSLSIWVKGIMFKILQLKIDKLLFKEVTPIYTPTQY